MPCPLSKPTPRSLQREDQDPGDVMVLRTRKPSGYSVLVGKGLAEVMAYRTVLPLLCWDVEPFGADMQLLMSGSAGTCVGQDGQLLRWVHDVAAEDVWMAGGWDSAAGRRVRQHYGRLVPDVPNAHVTVARNAAAATKATMATAAEAAGGVPRVMAVFSSSHFDESRWRAAAGQEAAIPIVNVAPYIWCVAERLHVAFSILLAQLCPFAGTSRHTPPTPAIPGKKTCQGHWMLWCVSTAQQVRWRQGGSRILMAPTAHRDDGARSSRPPRN